MNLGWITSFGLYIIGILLIFFTFKNAINHTQPSSKEKLEQFLQLEHEAQFARTKALPNDLLMKVDFSRFPCVENETCKKIYSDLMRFSNLAMANLADKSNLELKQAYGPQTLEKISAYEKNFFDFMNKTLKYGKTLLDLGYIQEARQTLELCANYHCDISKCYLLLIDIYKKQQDLAALSNLRITVQKEMCHSPFLHKVLEQL